MQQTIHVQGFWEEGNSSDSILIEPWITESSFLAPYMVAFLTLRFEETTGLNFVKYKNVQKTTKIIGYLIEIGHEMQIITGYQ